MASSTNAPSSFPDKDNDLPADAPTTTMSGTPEVPQEPEKKVESFSAWSYRIKLAVALCIPVFLEVKPDVHQCLSIDLLTLPCADLGLHCRRLGAASCCVRFQLSQRAVVDWNLVHSHFNGFPACLWIFGRYIWQILGIVRRTW
jgi:hypothetical protein